MSNYIFKLSDKVTRKSVSYNNRFGIKIAALMLEGGGFLNGSFLNEGLIDELSLILIPIGDGTSNSVTLFETSAFITKQQPVNFFLKEVEKLDDSGLWLKYVTKQID